MTFFLPTRSTQLQSSESMQNFPTIAIWNWLDKVDRQFHFIDFITPVACMATVSRWPIYAHALFYSIKTNSADTQGLICGPHVDFRW